MLCENSGEKGRQAIPIRISLQLHQCKQTRFGVIYMMVTATSSRFSLHSYVRFSGNIWASFNQSDIDVDMTAEVDTNLNDSLSSFLTQPHNLAFMLSIDWFQPYERGSYSLGAVYLIILNLPRHLRSIVIMTEWHLV